MFLEHYCQVDGEKISFTRQQASDFAKNVADDFNPLHDIDAKRFCVPGDLLFAISLETAGLSQAACRVAHFLFRDASTRGKRHRRTET